MTRSDFFPPTIWTYLSWPDLDHTLLLKHFNVTYKYVLPVILNVLLFP